MAKRTTGTVHAGGDMNWDLPPARCTTCRRRIIDWEVDDAAAFPWVLFRGGQGRFSGGDSARG
ncbi:MAG: hypothetical protein RR778_03475, partial [Glutamicibacter sp.]|uniref:hypothetical protein n=1 Tax=Glutamicibacter sp. TaxID=1931995 RepID=UPI002FCBF17C